MVYHFQMQKRKSCRKKMKKKTFLLVTAVALLLIFTSLGYCFNGRGQASAEESESADIVMVQKGDTLWSIAKTHRGRGEDIRYMVYKITKTNQLTDSMIYPGQGLIIPH